MTILQIKSDKSISFNNYLIKKIKADLAQSALFFNPTFLYHGKEHFVQKCIDSLQYKKGYICFSELLPIKYLIFNNRQLYWLKIMDYYQRNLNREYLIWRGKLANKKTYSRRIDNN